jgi:flagellar biosynthesis protein
MDAPERPSRRAIALEYDGARAPRISALGQDTVAEEIIALAREHGVPLLENPELAGLLAQLDLGDEIPETLYRCVAQIIAFAYRLRGRFPRDWTAPEDGADASATAAADHPALVSAGPQSPQP